jgi:hypothetical protein
VTLLDELGELAEGTEGFTNARKAKAYARISMASPNASSSSG